jgi:hypothetical protein
MEEEGIYREEVIAMMTAPLSIHADTEKILQILEGEEDDGEEEEMDS